MSAVAITIYDEVPGGPRSAPFRLELVSERITVEALIRRRVCAEVEAYNRATPGVFHGLVQPTDAERVLNGYRLRTRRLLDADEQCTRAVEAFQRNGFFMLVDGRQVDALDAEIAVGRATEVRFVKEVVAQALHVHSGRKGNFIPVNCAAIPEGLAEGELFGHTRGAFTGADAARKGAFVEADGGTLFLDEVGELPLGTQAKLLRVLENWLVVPVGSVRGVKVDVRLVAATNRDLDDEVKGGRFRQDLLFRLRQIPLTLPPLSARRRDVPVLAKHLAGEAKLDLPAIDCDAWEALLVYAWPGNVRELRNEVCRLSVDAPAIVGVAHLSISSESPPSKESPVRPDAKAISDALQLTKNNVSEAARRLGISRATINRRLAEMKKSS